MVDLLGTNINLPTIDISGFLSSTWIYVFIIAVIGIILIFIVAVVLFLVTYSRKIILFENISGRGYQPTIKTRARVLRIGRSGQELLKTLIGGLYFSAYGRKMGRNTYWYAKGQDGYYYNILLGDLDAKFRILDIELVDRDVRMFHLGIDKVAQQDYSERKGFVEKYGIHILIFIFLCIFLVGLYLIAGKINEGMTALSNPDTARINQDTAKLLNQVLGKLDTIQRGGDSGIISAYDNISGG